MVAVTLVVVVRSVVVVDDAILVMRGKVVL